MLCASVESIDTHGDKVVYFYFSTLIISGHGSQEVGFKLLRLSLHGAHDDSSYRPQGSKYQGLNLMVRAQDCTAHLVKQATARLVAQHQAWQLQSGRKLPASDVLRIKPWRCLLSIQQLQTGAATAAAGVAMRRAQHLPAGGAAQEIYCPPSGKRCSEHEA